MPVSAAPSPPRPALLAAMLDHLVVPPGESARLTTDPTAVSLVSPEIRHTDDVDEFRAWLCPPDDPLASGRVPFPRHLLPTRSWQHGASFRYEELTARDREDLRRAANCYLFGPRALVAGYRAALTHCYAPFAAAFYRVRRLEISSGAHLSVDGHPAVVRAEELAIRRTGQLRTRTAFRLDVGHLWCDRGGFTVGTSTKEQ